MSRRTQHGRKHDPVIGGATLLLFLFAGISRAASQQAAEERSVDFKKYYDRFNVEGSFVLYDLKRDRYTHYNKAQYRRAFLPASTFKICNSLISIETGVIRDENEVVKWDSVTRQVPLWNQDQDLKSAFKNSTVWFYQELARRIGGRRMKEWLVKARYGNADTSGGIDRFWLAGGLRITPEQQIEFLRRLRDGQLPFSVRTMEIVRKIMITEDPAGYVRRAKTGRTLQDRVQVGWYVGYIETKDNTYFFANCIQCADPEGPAFGRARIDITNSILHDLLK